MYSVIFIFFALLLPYIYIICLSSLLVLALYFSYSTFFKDIAPAPATALVFSHVFLFYLTIETLSIWTIIHFISGPKLFRFFPFYLLFLSNMEFNHWFVFNFDRCITSRISTGLVHGSRPGISLCADNLASCSECLAKPLQGWLDLL